MDIGDPTPSFAGARNASTTSAWAQRSARQATFAPLKFSPKVKELSGEAFDGIDPGTLIQGIEILRIYVPLDEMPLALLNTLLPDSEGLKEIHICIPSLLHPALQKVCENVGLERGLTSTIRRWEVADTTLRFFFLLPGVETGCENFGGFQEIELGTAIRGLARGSEELTRILEMAERGASHARLEVSSDANGNNGGNGMDLDEYL
jgi:hypothetical protein